MHVRIALGRDWTDCFDCGGGAAGLAPHLLPSRVPAGVISDRHCQVAVETRLREIQNVPINLSLTANSFKVPPSSRHQRISQRWDLGLSSFLLVQTGQHSSQMRPSIFVTRLSCFVLRTSCYCAMTNCSMWAHRATVVVWPLTGPQEPANRRLGDFSRSLQTMELPPAV